MNGARDISQKGVGLATAQVALNASSAVVVLAAKSRVFAEVKNLDASIVVYLGGDSSVTIRAATLR